MGKVKLAEQQLHAPSVSIDRTFGSSTPSGAYIAMGSDVRFARQMRERVRVYGPAGWAVNYAF